MGKLIAIEGTDASGKETQARMLYERLASSGFAVRQISFPMYESESSALVRMYLEGEFGNDPNDVNAYAASTFYAADRFASFRRDWGADYNSGIIIIADRYVPSNIIHQAAKLKGAEEKARFIAWLERLEYEIYGLPRPNLTVFLDMPPGYAAALMRGRKNKIDHSSGKDIHESSLDYLAASYANACEAAENGGWERVTCVSDGAVRSREDIADETERKVRSALLLREGTNA